MTGAVQRIADLSILVFVVSTMLAMGMSQRLAEVIAPLQRPLTVVLAIAVNFILAPLFALVLSRIIPLQPGHAVGLLLLGAAAGAPFLPKLAELCGGNLAYAVTLMVLLMGGSTLFMPFVLPLLVPGLTAEPWIIAKPLVLYMMIPLGIGFALALSRLSWVERLLPFVRRPVQLGSGAARRPAGRTQSQDRPWYVRQLCRRLLYAIPARAHRRGLGASARLTSRHGTSSRSGPDAATSRQPWWWRVKASTIQRPK